MTVPAHVLEVAAECAGETERAGRLAPQVVEALCAAKLFRLWIAKEFGGAGASVVSCLEAIEALSRADGSAGWCVMIANTTALTSHHLPERWAREIFAPDEACTGGYGMPAATARPVEGGIEVDGQWSWGSGTNHCTWIGGGVRIVGEDGEPAATPDGATTPFVFLEPGQVELLDTWQVAGLEGTASTDYRVERAFVPEGRWVQLVGGTPQIDSPLARFPFFGALATGISAVLIGLAEHAIEELKGLASKRSQGSSKTIAERAPIQADLALAMANVGQARSYLHAMAHEAWASAEHNERVGDDERAALRLAATACAKRCLEAVDLCFHAAGGAAVYRKNTLQRVFRDAHVAATHGMIAARTLEPIGRRAFGLPTSTAQF